VKTFATALLTFALTALSFSVYRAATTPWRLSAMHDVAHEVEPSTKPLIWNRVNPVDMTKAVAESAGPGGRIVLHLAGISAQKDMDHVGIYLEAGLVKHEGSEEAVKFHRAHAAELLIESVPMDGTSEAKFDVTQAFTAMLATGTEELRGFTVEFAQVPKNAGVKQTEESFFVQWTYFEIFDAQGKPVAQPMKLPQYADNPQHRDT